MEAAEEPGAEIPSNGRIGSVDRHVGFRHRATNGGRKDLGGILQALHRFLQGVIAFELDGVAAEDQFVEWPAMVVFPSMASGRKSPRRSAALVQQGQT
jgi:hypothetical protein